MEISVRMILVFFLVIFLVFSLPNRNFQVSRNDDKFKHLGGTTRKINFSPPLIHPFKSKTELNFESKEDPLGFSTSHFLYSHHEYVAMEGDKSKIERHRRAMLDMVDNYVEEDVKFTHKETKENISASVQGYLLTGVINLDDYEEVLDISCGENAENAENEIFKIKISSLSREFLEMLIPGTRLIFSYGWTSCHDETSRYLYVQKRSNFAVESKNDHRIYKLSFHVRSISFHELFDEISLDMYYTPPITATIKVPKKPYQYPAEYQQQSAIKRRGEYEATKTFNLLSWNYNGYKASQTIPIVNNYVSCSNCYAHASTTIYIKLRCGFLSIKEFIAKDITTIEGNVEITIDLSYQISKEYSFKLFQKTLSTISFTIATVPIWFQPELSLFGHFTLNTGGTIFYQKFGWSFEKSIVMGIVYDGKNFNTKYDDSAFKYGMIKPSLKMKNSGLNVNVGVKFELEPELTLFVYSFIPIKFSVLPSVSINGNINYERFKYSSNYALKCKYGMDPLQVPDSVKLIGGKKYTLGGKLPWEGSFNLVKETPLTCSVCSGEIKF